MQAKVIAACFALAGFAAVVVIGLYVGNPAPTVLLRAMIVGVIAFIVGSVIGRIAQNTVEGYVDRYKSENPLPSVSGDVKADDAGSDSQTADAESVIASNG